MRRWPPALLTVVVLAACGPEPGTPRQQIEMLLQRLEVGIEDGDIDPFESTLAAGFRGAGGMDRAAVLDRVRLYLLQHRRAHLLVRLKSVNVDKTGRAAVELLVGMAARPIDSAQVLFGYRASVYRITAELERRGGRWRAYHADWERAPPGALIRLM